MSKEVEHGPADSMFGERPEFESAPGLAPANRLIETQRTGGFEIVEFNAPGAPAV